MTIIASLIEHGGPDDALQVFELIQNTDEDKKKNIYLNLANKDLLTKMMRDLHDSIQSKYSPKRRQINNDFTFAQEVANELFNFFKNNEYPNKFEDMGLFLSLFGLNMTHLGVMPDDRLEYFQAIQLQNPELEWQDDINDIKNNKEIEKIKNENLKKIIKEEYKAVINERKEMISYHVDNKVPFSENVYRIGSNNYFTVIREARRLYKAGKLQALNEEDQDLFENSDLGEWVMFGGERVPLDFPMYVETLEERKKKKKKKKKDPPIGKPMKNSGSGKKYKVFVRNKKTGRIKKITYGDSKGGLKGNWNNAEARSSFAKRHKCAQKKDRTKPGYWACRAHKDFGTNVPGRFW